jgi:hypothetical protein
MDIDLEAKIQILYIQCFLYQNSKHYEKAKFYDCPNHFRYSSLIRMALCNKQAMNFTNINTQHLLAFGFKCKHAMKSRYHRLSGIPIFRKNNTILDLLTNAGFTLVPFATSGR